MSTPRDYCEARYLDERAKALGFWIDGGYGSIILRAGPKLAGRYGLVRDADLARFDTVEAALGWLAGWRDREMYETMAKGATKERTRP